jgi:hypothetical protein
MGRKLVRQYVVPALFDETEDASSAGLPDFALKKLRMKQAAR